MSALISKKFEHNKSPHGAEYRNRIIYIKKRGSSVVVGGDANDDDDQSLKLMVFGFPPIDDANE